MANYMKHKRNIAVLFYFAVFGTAFFVTSTLYLLSLQEDESLVEPDCVDSKSGGVTKNNLTSTIRPCIDTVHLEDWKLYAKTGLIYGMVCVLLGVIQVWSFFVTACMVKPVKNTNASGESQSGMNKKPKVWLDRKRGHQTNFGVWSACFKILVLITKYAVRGTLYFSSLIIPIYITASLIQTDAIQKNSEHLDWPALILVAICVISLTYVIAATFTIICLNRHFWDWIEMTSSSLEDDLDYEENDDEGIKVKGKPETELKDMSKVPIRISGYV